MENNDARFVRTVLGMSAMLVLVASTSESETLQSLSILGAILCMYLFLDHKSDQRWINNQ